MTVVPMPARGQWYADTRSGDDGDRALRASWHADHGCVVLSTWKDGRCTGSARLGPREAAALVSVLADGLAGLAEQTGTGPDEATRALGG